MRILAYTYYSKPWELKTGDDIRIQHVIKVVSEVLKAYVTVYNLSHLVRGGLEITLKDRIVYVSIPRRFYRVMTKLIRWKYHHDLNFLIKLTHYIDELLACIAMEKMISSTDRETARPILYITGSMTLASFFLRRLLRGYRYLIIYDPLSNYAQTLFLRYRKSLMELLRYSLYIAIHKLQLKSSDILVYPSKVDEENARRMFSVRKTMVIPNPLPLYYKSTEEYKLYRNMRGNDRARVYFILLAGARSKPNEEAVRRTIEIFNNIDRDRFVLFVTGPWLDLKNLVKNPSIKLTGVVPHEELKRLLAISDVGLAPVFTHAAGTFLKTLAYIAASLDIIASPYALQGIDMELLRGIRVYLTRNWDEFRVAVSTVLENSKDTVFRQRKPLLKNQVAGISLDGIYSLVKDLS